MPKQKPGKSKQDFETPDAFLQAVQARWGRFDIDLAAREDNKKAPICITPEQDSLKTLWPIGPLCWLNPPFADIAPWAEKCSKTGARVIMLTPASVGSEWFALHCWGKCQTVFVRPRITFVGAKDPYPKDCMLTLWNLNNTELAKDSFQLWRYDR